MNFHREPSHKRWIAEFFFALLLAVMLVFYAVRMYQYFPDRVPYVYTKNNVLANRVPGYQDLMDKVIQRIRASRS